MPCDYSKYPHNWKTVIRPAILQRAENHCERCGAPNHALIRRSAHNGAIYHVSGGILPQAADLQWGEWIRVVLTIAHLDHDVSNNHHANLAALCQRCHLRHDAKQHVETRRRKRAAKSEVGQ